MQVNFFFYKLTLLQEMAALLFQYYEKLVWERVVLIAGRQNFLFIKSLSIWPKSQGKFLKTEEKFLKMFSRLSAFFIAGNINQQTVETSLCECLC